MKRIISLLLIFVLAFGSVGSLICSATPPGYTDTGRPILYIVGQGGTLLKPDGTVVYAVTVPENYIQDSVSDCMPYFLSAIKDGEWDAYREKLVSVFAPIYEDIILDENGNSIGGVHADCEYTTDTKWVYQKAVEKAGKYSTSGNNCYSFYYDWRLSPYDILPRLKKAVEDIQAASGYDKINIVGRCEGSTLLLTYLEEYGTADVKNVEFYVPSCWGVESLSAIFSGNISVDQASLIRYKEQNLDLGDEILGQFLEATIDMLAEVYAIDLLSPALTIAIRSLYQKVVPAVLLSCYGTMPGIWTMVCPDEYEQARDNIFAGVEDKYAGLIEKLDKYYYNVASRIDEIITDAKADGVNFAIISKYTTYQGIPICETNYLIGDGSCRTTLSSGGATTSSITSVLPDSYIKSAEKNGTAKYISPDKKVDASTCLLPDTTWFIFGSIHKDFPNSIHTTLMDKFFYSDGKLTVFDDENIPQYLTYLTETDTVVPMTAENGFVTESVELPTKKSIKEKALEFVRKLLTLLASLFEKWLGLGD